MYSKQTEIFKRQHVYLRLQIGGHGAQSGYVTLFAVFFKS